MNILALEFSSEQRSVAILPSTRSGARVPPAPITSSVRTSPRTLQAFHLIETALAQARIEREQIDCVAVGLGPGSYTGIRAAISIAQSWQLARGVKLLGIGSVEGLALQAQKIGIHGRVTFAIDAQRNEFYIATYEIEPDRLKIIEPLRLAAFADVAARAKAGEKMAGPEVANSLPNARVLFPDAGALASLAAARIDFVAGEALEPIYLRETAFVKAPPPAILPTG